MKYKVEFEYSVTGCSTMIIEPEDGDSLLDALEESIGWIDLITESGECDITILRSTEIES